MQIKKYLQQPNMSIIINEFIGHFSVPKTSLPLNWLGLAYGPLFTTQPFLEAGTPNKNVPAGRL